MEQIKTILTDHWKFILLTALLLCSTIYSAGMQSTYFYVARSLLSGVLIAFYISSVKYQNNIFITSLIFSLIGDILFMFPSLQANKMSLISYAIFFIFLAWSNRRYHRNINTFQKYSVFLVIVAFLLFGWSKINSSTIVSFTLVLVISYILSTVSIILRDTRLKGYYFLIVSILLLGVSTLLLLEYTSPDLSQAQCIILFQTLGILLVICGFIVEQKHLS